jgi:pyridoxine 5-phosphate synthase
MGVAAVELHTGRYADAPEGLARQAEFEALRRAAASIVADGLELHAGHGLNFRNVGPIARIDRMAELNIGHSIVSRAVFVGLGPAVREMKDCISRALLGPSG